MKHISAILKEMGYDEDKGEFPRGFLTGQWNLTTEEEGPAKADAPTGSEEAQRHEERDEA